MPIRTNKKSWLGYKISPNGVIATKNKTNAISEMEQTHTV